MCAQWITWERSGDGTNNEFELELVLLCHALACPAHKGLHDTIINTQTDQKPKKKLNNTTTNDMNHLDVSSRL